MGVFVNGSWESLVKESWGVGVVVHTQQCRELNPDLPSLISNIVMVSIIAHKYIE